MKKVIYSCVGIIFLMGILSCGDPEPAGIAKAWLAANVSGETTAELETLGTGVPAFKAIGNDEVKRTLIAKRSLIKDAPHALPPVTRVTTRLTSSDTSTTFTLAKDIDTSDTTAVPATLVYGSGSTKCLIYAETATDTNAQATWDSLGAYFDTNIFPKMTNAFGAPSDVDGNGQIIILYYAFAPDNVLGFFSPSDITSASPMEIFYMNLDWGPVDYPDMIRTLSHEFQHMINYGNRSLLGKSAMDTWMDEGLAESAEHIVSGTPGTSRIDTFTNDANNKIRNGQTSLCVWDGSDENYAIVYLFMQYCKNQASSGEAFFKTLLNASSATSSDIGALMNTENSSFSTFPDVLKGFWLANILSETSGIKGYEDEASIFNFKGKIYSPTLAPGSINLNPGCAVYLPYSTDTTIETNDSGDNIQFIKVE